MLATDFHIMNRKISMEYPKRKSQCKSFGVQHAIPFLTFVKICVYLNDIFNQAISLNIEKIH